MTPSISDTAGQRHAWFPAHPLSGRVEELTRQHLQLWWSMPTSIPDLLEASSLHEKLSREKHLEAFVKELLAEAQHPPLNPASRQETRLRLEAAARQAAKSGLGFTDRHLDAVLKTGFLEAAAAFADLARRFDPALPAEAIYQASRNVWTMNLIQVLMGLPLQVTPAVFAYSLLYPYSDNTLDDPHLSPGDKRSFIERFSRRLNGEQVSPSGADEEKIFTLVGMIEGQYERASFPLVYASLQAIHQAQEKSLRLLRPGASPFEVDVLGISFEKGGTSVLADGYLVNGSLTPAQEEALFGYGVFTQLMDDQEDAIQDAHAGLATAFSLTTRGWPLDATLNQLFGFERRVLEKLDCFSAPGCEPLKELVRRSIDLLLVDAAAQGRRNYSRDYLRALETRYPMRFSFLERQRKKLERSKPLLTRLVEAMTATEDA
ncbi:MAG: hypothetical protein M1281_14125 [Chloroflexi bacterium]|nr:hypothetical protein [Chloroflexota bacterium]